MTAQDFYMLPESARLPPVAAWNLLLCGDNAVHVARDGALVGSGLCLAPGAVP